MTPWCVIYVDSVVFSVYYVGWASLGAWAKTLNMLVDVVYLSAKVGRSDAVNQCSRTERREVKQAGCLRARRLRRCGQRASMPSSKGDVEGQALA